MAKKATKSTATATADKRTSVSPQLVKEIRESWPPARAEAILKVMREDGISYERAVKRSRRRLIGAGQWE